jgi:hypothetical protein
MSGAQQGHRPQIDRRQCGFDPDSDPLYQVLFDAQADRVIWSCMCEAVAMLTLHDESRLFLADLSPRMIEPQKKCLGLARLLLSGQ